VVADVSRKVIGDGKPFPEIDIYYVIANDKKIVVKK
jgi:hypothetical protein